MDDVRIKIRTYLARSLRNKDFDDNDDLFKMGLVHSLFAIQLVVFIEKNFGIELENEDLNFDKIRSVNDLIQLVEKKQLSIR